MDSMGPSDATVLISLDDYDAVYDNANYKTILDALSVLGQILLIRFGAKPKYVP